MFKICLFDLDNTLVRTEDLKDVREACKNHRDTKAVRATLNERRDRHLYGREAIRNIRREYPEMKLGVFTRSPRIYADTVLAWAYPGFPWDIVVAYEDVRHTKPYGDGIDCAMKSFNVRNLDEVMLVGDEDVDVRAAYHCGCVAVLDRGSWPVGKKRQEHWAALTHVPDAVIDSPAGLMHVLADPVSFLPALERLLANDADFPNHARFDRINHFVPGFVGEYNTAFPVHVCGRSFSRYESLENRRQRHELTRLIEEHKDAARFPDTWIHVVRRFVADQYRASTRCMSVLVTAIPARPGRKDRLGSLLAQLRKSLIREPIEGCNVSVSGGVLAFRDGVQSQHNDHLNREQRFANIRDHLIVRSPRKAMEYGSVLVLDDVVTTGASLIGATVGLKAAGVKDVRCLAMAKSISDVLWS